jgi:hypothetical protein
MEQDQEVVQEGQETEKDKVEEDLAEKELEEKLVEKKEDVEVTDFVPQMMILWVSAI